MNRKLSLPCFLIVLNGCLLTFAAPSPNEPNTPPVRQAAEPNQVALDDVLASMHTATQKLTSAQTDIFYLTIEDPDLLATNILRTGVLYYLKDDQRSHLRIHFNNLKQDDFEPEERPEDYLFDGVWLTRIDYKLKQIDAFQQAPEDKPADVFELIRQNFPLVGFSDIKTLNKDFTISLAHSAQDPCDSIHLLLTTNPQSPFAKEYAKIDFWINNSSFLPARILAYSVQGDLHDIRFSNLQINKNLEKAVFTIEKPSGFRENREPLKNTGNERK
ncbi:MAG: hypothetical protein LLF76_13335 [Planctomycetaceae bacterium]|nr:hypothetical protein [Planctomycetaceae bacterium]